MRSVKLLAVAVLAIVLALSSTQNVSAQTVIVSCPFASVFNADSIDRGFYIAPYPGETLGTVHVQYLRWTGGTGVYTVVMTARVGAYDGPIIGSQTVTVSLSSTAWTDVTFNFGGAPVAKGSTVTFTQVQTAGPIPDDVLYNIGNTSPPCPAVFETEDTTPPLSTFLGHTVGLEITGSPAAPVGGVVLPMNKVIVFAPWLAVIGLVGCVIVVGVVVKRRRL
jgi:hypothetical protein